MRMTDDWAECFIVELLSPRRVVAEVLLRLRAVVYESPETSKQSITISHGLSIDNIKSKEKEEYPWRMQTRSDEELKNRDFQLLECWRNSTLIFSPLKGSEAKKLRARMWRQGVKWLTLIINQNFIHRESYFKRRISRKLSLYAPLTCETGIYKSKGFPPFNATILMGTRLTITVKSERAAQTFPTTPAEHRISVPCLARFSRLIRFMYTPLAKVIHPRLGKVEQPVALFEAFILTFCTRKIWYTIRLRLWNFNEPAAAPFHFTDRPTVSSSSSSTLALRATA